MAVIALSVLIFLIALAALAIGVLAGREPIEGSCGGLACIDKLQCGACPRSATRQSDN